MKTVRMIGFYMTTVILDPHKSHTWNLVYLPTRDHELSGALWKKHCCGLPHLTRSPEARATGGCLFCHPGHPKWEWFGTIPLVAVCGSFSGKHVDKKLFLLWKISQKHVASYGIPNTQIYECYLQSPPSADGLQLGFYAATSNLQSRHKPCARTHHTHVQQLFCKKLLCKKTGFIFICLFVKHSNALHSVQII